MPDGILEDGDIHALDLARRQAHFLITPEAARHAAHVNLLKDGRVALHIKYLAARGGVVLNDMRDGAWQEEVFLECAPPGPEGLPVSLAVDEAGAQLGLPGAPPRSLAGRFDLAGALSLRLPRGIRLGAAPLAPDRPPVPAGGEAGSAMPALGLDALITGGPAFYLEGWVDDRCMPLARLALYGPGGGAPEYLPVHRVRRSDVEAHLQAARPHEFGFWSAHAGAGMAAEGASLAMVMQDGSCIPLPARQPMRQDPQDFLDFLLARFGSRQLLGNRVARSFADLDAGHGAVLARLHRQGRASRAITSDIAFGPKVSPPGRPAVSLICVLYGIPDFLYLLVAQFARFPGIEALEFVFVSNSPELEEVLVRDAELASLVFGARIRLVTLDRNCGFSHANNIGVAQAAAPAICIINPDVFPRHGAAVAHLLALAEAGLEERVLGGKLFYADGSVMHEGMFFNRDGQLSGLCGQPVCTVEHFRKGFPDTADPAPRPVPAVTGAFMLMDRRFFDRLSGFNTEVIHGHYEDADLCLRAREAGGAVLLDPALQFSHYEGIGSVKRPEHAGSALYNRWYFSQRWGRHLAAGMDG